MDSELDSYINSLYPENVEKEVISVNQVPETQVYQNTDYPNFQSKRQSLFRLIFDTVVEVGNDILNADFDDIFTKGDRQKGITATLGFIIFCIFIIRFFTPSGVPTGTGAFRI